MKPKNIVDTVIATFAVFTGFTLNARLEKFQITGFSDEKLWLFVISATLLLRYIIGSAVHLNRTYVEDVEGKGRPRSRSALFLFKDLVFLVVFGILAVKLAKEGDARNVLYWAAWFIAAGLIWVAVDYPLRAAFAKLWYDDYERAPRDVSLSWAAIDIAQVLLTLLFLQSGQNPSPAAIISLAGIYIICLALDFLVLFYNRPWAT